VQNILFNVCPNCGGGFEKRPARPSESIINNPASENALIRPIDSVKFKSILLKYKNIHPQNR
jgi:hypothetical protein